MDPSFKIKTFFREHERPMTFLGAFIVFTTYVVKEGYRDNLRTLADSINNAENVFLIRSEVEESSRPHYNGVASANIKRSPGESATIDHANIYRYFDDISYKLDNISRLIKRLPDSKALITFPSNWTESVRVIQDSSGYIALGNTFELPQKKTSSEQLEILKKHLKDLAALDLNSRKLMRPDHSNDEAAAVSAREVSFKFSNLLLFTERFGGQVLREAVKEETASEHSYQIYTYASYCLYALGWILGLLGRFAGVDNLIGEQ